MKASPLDLQGKGAIIRQHLHLLDPFSFLCSDSKNAREGIEPRSVLDHIRSPSPPSSTSTLSSSSALAALSDSNPPPWPPSSDKREEWVPDLQPIPIDLSAATAAHKSLDDWESIMLDSSNPTVPPPQDHSFLKWIMSDVDDSKPQEELTPAPVLCAEPEAFGSFAAVLDDFGLEQLGGTSNGKAPLFYSADSIFLPSCLAPQEEKPQFLAGNLVFQQMQNPSFLLPFSTYPIMEPPPPPPVPPASKRLNSMPITSATVPQDHFLQHRLGPIEPYPFPGIPRPPGSDAMAPATQQQRQQQELVDQLFKAAELIGGGNFVNAQGILARLNHQLSPVGKPLIRSAFYLKEALNAAAAADHAASLHPKPPTTPLDVVLKISAYKGFSEISPLLQFTNFTCVQTLLEELVGCERIHIVDFDIGFGGQWSSFMQELSQRHTSNGTNAASSLKITAFISPSSYHPLELALTRDNLVHFASGLNIPFEFNVLSLDSFDPTIFNMSRSSEAIAVSIPVGSLYQLNPSLLYRVKQLSPKIVVSVDHGCDRCELPFSQHFLNLLNSYKTLLESIDAAGANLDATNKIERLLLQPRIEGAVLGGHRVTEKLIPWRVMFASVGFVPVHFSNFTETQAECLLKRVQVRGFHAEKRQSSLVLFWQHGELVSVSAWRC